MRLKRLTRQLNWADRNRDYRRYRYLKAELQTTTGVFYQLVADLAQHDPVPSRDSLPPRQPSPTRYYDNNTVSAPPKRH